MPARQYLYAALSLALLFVSATRAEQTASPYEQVKKIKELIGQIQNNYAQQNQQSVYLGNQQIFMPSFADKLTANMNELMSLLRQFEEIKSGGIPSDLQWTPVNNSTREKLVNAVDVGENINICRAPFFGAYLQGQGLYPGQIANGGCRISYGGYAFIVTKFDLLTGSNKQLQWVSIDDVNKQVAAKLNQTTKQPDPHPAGTVNGYMPLQQTYPLPNNALQAAINDITINHARPVSGGYEGGNPVLICRAKQDNEQVIGKVVFFDAGGNKGIQGACDIGVNDKEVVIVDAYDLLFWKGVSG